MAASRLLEALWDRYASEVPYARTFVQLSQGARGAAPSNAFTNDHIALRSLARPGGGIEMFARVFEGLGWERKGSYAFPEVHLRAIHLSHPGNLPRVFVSELLADELPEPARAIVSALEVDPVPPSDEDSLAAWFAAPLRRPSREDLETVDRVSQYGAWLLAFGRKVNHFTASVDDIEAWVPRLQTAGVPMKTKIEGERGNGTLRQTATAAATLPVMLRDGHRIDWPYAYFEIAQRTPGFDGFLTPQARQLFDMTKRDART